MGLQMVFLIWSSLAYGLAFHARGPTSFLLIVLRGVLFDWLLVGLVVATACRYGMLHFVVCCPGQPVPECDRLCPLPLAVCRWIANRYLLRLRSHR